MPRRCGGAAATHGLGRGKEQPGWPGGLDLGSQGNQASAGRGQGNSPELLECSGTCASVELRLASTKRAGNFKRESVREKCPLPENHLWVKSHGNRAGFLGALAAWSLSLGYCGRWREKNTGGKLLRWAPAARVLGRVPSLLCSPWAPAKLSQLTLCQKPTPF